MRFEFPSNLSNKISKVILLTLLTFLFLGFFCFAQFDNRAEFWTYFSLYTFLFGLYVLLLLFFSRYSGNIKYPDKAWFWVSSAFLLRIAFFSHHPMLSDDYFRYFFDGCLWHLNVNPYASLPADLSTIISNHPELIKAYEQMNSATYFTVYPPVLQLFYWISAQFSGFQIESFLLTFRSLILGVECLTVYAIFRSLKILQKPLFLTAVYAFNPLIIIELTGNLHNEVFMIGALSLCFWMLLSQKFSPATVWLGLAAGAKLLPLMIFPILSKLLPNRSWIWILGALSVFCLSLLPLASFSNATHFAQSLDLYFQSFEFNASIYYLFRAIGYQIYGFNVIHVLGPVLAGLTVFITLFLSYKAERIVFQSVINCCALIWLTYLLLSTTIHPWYIAILVFFAVYTQWKSLIWWSFAVFSSYYAYSFAEVHESFWVLSLQYIPLFILLVMDLQKWLGHHKSIPSHAPEINFSEKR